MKNDRKTKTKGYNGFDRVLTPIKKNIKQYVCFFLALLLVQTAVMSLQLTFFSVRSDVEALISDGYTVTATAIIDGKETNVTYTRHMRIDYLTDQTRTYLENGVNSAVSIGQNNEFSFIDYETVIDAVGRKTFSAYVSLKEPLKENAAKFIEKYVDVLDVYVPGTKDNLAISYTPAYTVDNELASITADNVKAMLLATLLSVLALTLLYTININSFKHRYGVYMSFGADFKKLLVIASRELALISALILPISVIISVLVNALIIKAFTVTVTAFFISLAVTVGVSMVSITVAAILPIKRISVSAPVDLIVAKDNSDRVSSPRSSYRLFGASFPFKYEWLTTVRFRKHYVQTIISAALFCIVFVSCMCLSDMSRQDADTVNTAYEVAVYNQSIEDGDAYQKYLDGVEKILKLEQKYNFIDHASADNSVALPSLNSHVVLPMSSLASSKSHYVSTNDPEGLKAAAASEFNIASYNASTLKYLAEKGVISIDGDYSLLDSTTLAHGYVVVSEYINNEKAFDLSVGDKIYIATHTGGEIPSDYPIYSTLDSLEAQLEYMSFTYKTYTVCAVMREADDVGNATIIIPPDDYKNLCGSYPIATLKLNVKNGSDLLEVYSARTDMVRDLPAGFNWRLTDSTDYSGGVLLTSRRLPTLFTVFGIIMLLLSPLVWICAQTVFYKKRETEINTLIALGSPKSRIKRLYTFGACIVTVCALILSFAFGTLACLGLYAASEALSAYGFASLTGAKNASYDFAVPWLALTVSATVSALGGFVATVLPYAELEYTRNKNQVKHMSPIPKKNEREEK
ncbi:MAG: ABC transporter permease [Clostridia bacterium]|nr:ABC transporter permease [Clostridia bacterium]